MSRISVPGIYQMPAAEYHALEAPTPVLSSSLARILLAQSPLHAWYRHPALGHGEREEGEHLDIGTAAHGYLLEGDTSVVVVDAADWRTKAAKEARDEARAAGKVAILAHKWDAVKAMATAAREQLETHEKPTPFTNGKAEQTLVWREGDVWMKSRLDWLHDSGLYVDDYKSTSASANPETWCRSVFDSGIALQAAFYVRGIRAVLGVDAVLRFIVQETYAPYALSVIGLGPDAMTIAEKQVIFAIDLWRDCMSSGQWPGYPTRTAYATLPPWVEASWMAREEANL